MTEVERIVDQFRRAFEGGAWHGPALLEIIEQRRTQSRLRHTLFPPLIPSRNVCCTSLPGKTFTDEGSAVGPHN